MPGESPAFFPRPNRIDVEPAGTLPLASWHTGDRWAKGSRASCNERFDTFVHWLFKIVVGEQAKQDDNAEQNRNCNIPRYMETASFLPFRIGEQNKKMDQIKTETDLSSYY